MSTTTQRPAEQERALHAALSSSARPPRASALSAALTFAWRAMLKIKHVPEQLLDVTVTPVLFLLMFTYLFGGAVAGSTSEYLQYILPGILVQSVLFTTVYSGVTLNTDMTKGVVDRFRTLPIWPAAPLLGAMLGDSVRYVFAGTIVMLVGIVLGFDPEGGVAGVVTGVALVVLFSFALAWVFTTMGALLRSQNAVMNAGFMGLFPLIFLSNIFVEPDTLPSGLETFVELNPISHLTTAVRAAMAGELDSEAIAVVAGTAVVLTAIFAPLTVHLYRSRN